MKKFFFLIRILLLSSFFYCLCLDFYSYAYDSIPNKYSQLRLLLENFKKYKTTNTRWHSGDLYEHSVWTANAIQNWWDEESFWVKGLDEKDRALTVLAGLLHDIGKAGDLEYWYGAKEKHPDLGFKYIAGAQKYLLNEDAKSFDFDNYFVNHSQQRKIVAILTGTHWDFGGILKGIYEGASKEVLFEEYLNKLKKYAKYVGYNNGVVNDRIVRMAILIGAADVKGTIPVFAQQNMFSISTPKSPRPVFRDYYERYNFEHAGRSVRGELIKYFHTIWYSNQSARINQEALVNFSEK